MAGAYLVTFPDSMAAIGSRNGVRAAVVFADNAVDAAEILEAQFGNDIDMAWENADTALISADTDLIGWTLRVQVISPEFVVVADKSVIGAGGDNTIDEIAALMVIALNTTVIDGAAYNSGTQVLKVAETTDNLGDHHILVEWYPPAPQQRKAIPGFVVSKVDVGSANAALTVTFPADAYTVPLVAAKFSGAK